MCSNPPALYFPVRDAPLKMEARLQRLGTDFGNGIADQSVFQRDREALRYRDAKRRVAPQRHGTLTRQPTERLAHQRILAWIESRLDREHPGHRLQPSSATNLHQRYERVANFVQEDFAVVQRDPEAGGDRTIAMFVAFPSSWRPEQSLGASFAEIHSPVPGFAEVRRQTESMVASMVERGPYVRFVWTVCADDTLDHHPDEGERRAWGDASAGWLRVERQITIPFPAEESALFVIRTYLYPFASLSDEHCKTLSGALERMPRAIARYKGLDEASRRIAQHLLAESRKEGV